MRSATLCLSFALALAVRAQTPDPPAEEKYKNIQVFKGTPSSKILPAMFFMRGSLGVSCNHCHVNFRDFEKDDNPKKATARTMILMVRGLNQNQFGGQTAITCNTCHRGHPKPIAPLAFAAIVEATPKRLEVPAQAEPALPTADAIFDRYVAATGRTLASLELNGSMLTSEGWTGALTVDLKAPAKAFVTYEVPTWPAFQASNGSIGWSQDNHGLHDLAGKRLQTLQKKMIFFEPRRLKEQYQSLTAAGRETVAGRDAFAVSGKLPDGELETLYFDAQSGLLVRVSKKTDTPLGALPNEIDFEDYRDVGGAKIPFMVTEQAPDFSSAYKIERATPNAAIDDARFEKPATPLPSMHK